MTLEVAVDTRQTEGLTESVEKHDTLVATSTNDVLYQNPNDALKAVREDYLYWTGKLTDTSWQLSYAIIAANWAVFGSVDKLLGNLWSKLSVSLVIVLSEWVSFTKHELNTQNQIFHDGGLSSTSSLEKPILIHTRRKLRFLHR
jgi:hypothetical protein